MLTWCSVGNSFSFLSPSTSDVLVFQFLFNFQSDVVQWSGYLALTEVAGVRFPASEFLFIHTLALQKTPQLKQVSALAYIHFSTIYPSNPTWQTIKDIFL
jgi:hypothetical protein